MLIADALITKQFWEPTFAHIQHCFEFGNYFKMHGRNVYTMEWRGMWLFVAATVENPDDVEVHGWLLLDKPKPSWECWEVMQSFVFTVCRGQGYGHLLYDAVIRSGLILASGTQQTAAARRMWMKLAQNEKYHVWAHDFEDLKIYEPVIYDAEKDELWFNLPLYEKDRTKLPGNYHGKPTLRDIRLVAIKRA